MKTRLFLIIAAAGICGAPVLHGQGGGSLTPPPGPPGPTMKGLDQIDPGTPLDPTLFPPTGYVISQPGSYYLTGNVTAIVATESAIVINASDVTLDLRGHSIIAASGTASTPVDSAIYAGSQSNITVRNGSIVGAWYAAIYTTGSNCSAEALRVSRMTTYGIRLDDGARIIRCSAEGTGVAGVITLAGLSADTHSLVKDCTAALCDGDGIAVGAYSLLLDSVAYDNSSEGIQGGNGCVISRCSTARNTGRGILVFDGSTVSECSSHDNTGIGISADQGSNVNRSGAVSNVGIGIAIAQYGVLADCNSATNTGGGFTTDFGCAVHNCAAGSNDGDGFSVSTGTVLIACTAHSNGVTASNSNADGFQVPSAVRMSRCAATFNRGIGIRASSAAHYIEGSTILLNTGGDILLPDTTSVVINNRFDDITPAPSGFIGPFHDASTTKPFSNF